jgi:hypothetical protein
MLKKILITVLEIALIALFIMAVLTVLDSFSIAEDSDGLFTAYVVCQKDDYVHARMKPTRKSQSVGRFDGGDEVVTDGYVKNGFLRCYGFETGVAWVHKGYVVYDRPEKVDGQTAYSVSRGTLNARRYIGGKVIHKLENLDEVKVYWWSDEWAVTSKGFIQTKYLEIEWQ